MYGLSFLIEMDWELTISCPICGATCPRFKAAPINRTYCIVVLIFDHDTHLWGEPWQDTHALVVALPFWRRVIEPLLCLDFPVRFD